MWFMQNAMGKPDNAGAGSYDFMHLFGLVALGYMWAQIAKAALAQKNLLPRQPGDVPETYADIDDLVRDVGYRPATPIEVGVERFVDWFRDYYGYPR